MFQKAHIAGERVKQENWKKTIGFQGFNEFSGKFELHDGGEKRGIIFLSKLAV